MRMHIIGAAGAGKTTLAKHLSGQLHLRHVELDGVYWLPGWQRAADTQFRGVVSALVTGDQWIMDGTYDVVRDLIWRRVDTVVWLDYPATTVVYGLLRRGVRDILRQTDMWGTRNRESWRLLLGRDALLVRSLRTLKRMRMQYPLHASLGTYRHVEFVRLHSRTDARRWLISLMERPVCPQPCCG